MGFNNQLVEAAVRTKAEMRAAAEAKARAKKNQVYRAYPQLGELDQAISQVGSRIAIAALDGADLTSIRARLEQLTEERTALLQSAGYTDADFQPQYNCPLCQDTGIVSGRRCSCIGNLCRKQLFESMTVSMPLEESTFDRFDVTLYPESTPDGLHPRQQMTRILHFCENYAAEFGPESKNLLFFGNTGLGKTHLSLAIAGQVIAKGYSVMYGAAVDLFGRVEKEHFTGNHTDTLDLMLDCDLLILDDLGTEFISQFSRSVLNQVVNSRLQSRKPTILSTNFDFNQLETMYDSRITSRLIGSYKPLPFQGDDIRIKQIAN